MSAEPQMTSTTVASQPSLRLRTSRREEADAMGESRSENQNRQPNTLASNTPQNPLDSLSAKTVISSLFIIAGVGLVLIPRIAWRMLLAAKNRITSPIVSGFAPIAKKPLTDFSNGSIVVPNRQEGRRGYETGSNRSGRGNSCFQSHDSIVPIDMTPDPITIIEGIVHIRAASQIRRCIEVIRQRRASEIFVDTAGLSRQEFTSLAQELYDQTAVPNKLWRPVIVGPLSQQTDYLLFEELGRRNIRVTHKFFKEYADERQRVGDRLKKIDESPLNDRDRSR